MATGFLASMGTMMNHHKPKPKPSGYTGPLDIVPGAVVAYGQRALSAAKRGSAVYTIRESGGGTTQSFASDATTGAVNAAAISAFIGSGSGSCALWNDQSGNAVDALQATAALQPGWVANAVNNRPSFSISTAANQSLGSSINATVPAGSQTIFCVAKVTDASSLIVISDTLSFIQFIYQGGLGRLALDAFDNSSSHEAGGRTIGIGGIAGAYSVMDAAWGFGSTDPVFWNGNSFAQDNSNDAGGALGSISGTVSIGAIAASFVTFDGEILELVAYSGLLTAAQRLAIRQNIATYYGITLL